MFGLGWGEVEIIFCIAVPIILAVWFVSELFRRLPPRR
jgi:hypothetical protein